MNKTPQFAGFKAPANDLQIHLFVNKAQEFILFLLD